MAACPMLDPGLAALSPVAVVHPATVSAAVPLVVIPSLVCYHMNPATGELWCAIT